VVKYIRYGIIKTCKGEKISMLNNLGNIIVKYRKQIGILFLIFTILSLIGMKYVKVNYDLSSYIPSNMPSKSALDLTKEEFGMQSTARIMINNISLSKAKEYKEKISDVDGVYQVLWIDDIDVYQPYEFIENEDISKYYKDGSALFDIMFDEDDYSDKTDKAVSDIQKLLPIDSNFIGAAVDTKNSRESLENEMIKIMAFLIPLTIIILILTTDSYFSCIIFIIVIGISILFNMGTNIIFKDVSFITFSISAALQFAVSMDYSVFMLHQYEEEKKKIGNKEKAMKLTVKETFISIFSSSLTTVAGFLALAFMNFGIGKDIGFVFAKGILFSLLCVIFIMPFFILTFENLLEKTKHKRLLPSFDNFARSTMRIGGLIIAISLILIVPSYVAQKNNDFTYGTASFGSGPGSKAYIDEQKIVEKFGRSNPILIIVPNKDYYTEKLLVDEYESLEVVDKVLTLVNTVPKGVPYDFVDEDLYNKFQNEEHTRIVVYVRTSSESDLATKTLDQIKSITSKYYGDDFKYTGTIPITLDMQKSIEEDYNTVNLISIGAILVILMFTFKSIITPIILTIVIESGIILNMAIPYYMDESLIFIGYLVVSSVELGATIDYAILLTNNYIKFRKSYNKKMAAITSIKESLPSILTSGAILVCAGYIIKFNSSLKAVSDMGELIGRGALISIVFVVIVLPVLLTVFDGLITRKLETYEKASTNKDKVAESSNKEKGKTKENRSRIKRLREIRKEKFKKLNELRKEKIKELNDIKNARLKRLKEFKKDKYKLFNKNKSKKELINKSKSKKDEKELKNNNSKK